MKEILSVAEQAAEWLPIMESPTPEERVAFWAWLDASPLHVRELILAVKTHSRLRGFDKARRLDVEALIEKARSNVARIDEHPEIAPTQCAPRRRWPYAIAAAVGLLTLGIVAAFSLWTNRDTYTTEIGQQLVLQLDDGSVVYLNTGSRMKVRFSGHARDIYLPNGHALFEVEPDRVRPFRVHTDSGIVEAVGTQFDVRVFDERTVVSVVEGVVQLLQQHDDAVGASGVVATVALPRLAAGEAATINAAGDIERTEKIDVSTVSAWKQQRLVFVGETLSWIADEFNRYNAAPRLTVEGAALRLRRFNGSFNAHSPESLVEYLRDDPSIAFEKQGDEIVIREAGTPVPH